MQPVPGKNRSDSLQLRREATALVMLKWIRVPGVVGNSADRRVLLGFASSRLLQMVSFADVVDEDTGGGYQRRPNSQHSLDFRRYIQCAGSSTIPLTFNARPREDGAWRLATTGSGARLEIRADAGRVLSQVDC